MTPESKIFPEEKIDLHPRNKHRLRYDFKQLCQTCPELTTFVSINKYKNESIDFSNPRAVKMLNKALLDYFYGIKHWDIPANYLCPPIPGRADYIHYAADLLSTSNDGILPKGSLIKVLDIGIGANCVYPIIGTKEYGWKFVGSDIDPMAIQSAKKIITENFSLTEMVECRLQNNSVDVFKGIMQPNEAFDLSICNPPFHASLAEAEAGTERKWKNLRIKKNNNTKLNFGGQNSELWCKGGEENFVRKMIEQSAQLPTTCFWYSTLISKKENLAKIYVQLKNVNVFDVRTINMTQGQKISRFVAWTFLNEQQQNDWRIKRWQK